MFWVYLICGFVQVLLTVWIYRLFGEYRFMAEPMWCLLGFSIFFVLYDFWMALKLLFEREDA